MSDTAWGLIIIGLVILFFALKKRKSPKANIDREEENAEKKDLPIQGAYEKRWLFSYNEKYAYKRLKEIADQMGYTVFTKVRLLDLLEPVKNNPKYKTYFYKVQAKHVDFVLCDNNLNAQHIIELDDSSHDRKDRKERDEFVDAVLKSVGYNIIHTRAITEDIKEQLK